MTIEHTRQNRCSIQAINDQIQSSNTFHCGNCTHAINPSASNPKDQELSCTKCSALFHKKCTDRRKSTSNWRKTPWYCAACIQGTSFSNAVNHPDAAPLHNLGISRPHPEPLSSSSPVQTSSSRNGANPLRLSGNSHSHEGAQGGYDRQADDCLSLPIQHQGQDYGQAGPLLPPNLLPQHTGARQIVQSQVASADDQSDQLLPHQVEAQDAVGQPVLGDQPLSLPLQPPGLLLQHDAQAADAGGRNPPKFPSTSSRQRSSNVNDADPEREFLKTALSSCRSTISQQEAELRRLNECLDIRNKRIAQLEVQIGHASDYVSARNTHSNIAENNLNTVDERLENLYRKIERLENPSTSNNITINSCHSSKATTQQHSSTQTVTPPGYTALDNDLNSGQQSNDVREAQESL